LYLNLCALSQVVIPDFEYLILYLSL